MHSEDDKILIAFNEYLFELFQEKFNSTDMRHLTYFAIFRASYEFGYVEGADCGQL